MSDYYRIMDMRPDGKSAVFDIEINPECSVFKGHFPGNPVCPGVCNIQMMKECAEKVLGRKAVLANISQCRLTSLMLPQEDRKVKIRIDIEENAVPARFTSELYNDAKTFVKMKGELAEPASIREA